MGKPLSMDIRSRALAAVDAGSSRRGAARRFGVSVSSVIRWDASRRATGSFEPKPQGGDMRSRGLDERRAEIMVALEEEGDQTLDELRARLAAQGFATSTSALSRFFCRHGRHAGKKRRCYISRKYNIAKKKTGHAGTLTDAQWARIENHLPGRDGLPGRSGVDNRLFVDAVLWLARTASPWRDLPPELGRWTAVHARFRHWTDAGVRGAVFNRLSEDPDFGYVLIDSTACKAHADAAGAKGGLSLRASGARLAA